MLTPNFRLYHNVVQLLFWDEYCLFSSVKLYIERAPHIQSSSTFVHQYLATIQIRATLSLSSATFQNKMLYSHS